MTNANNTTAIAPATLTERELFAAFLKMEIPLKHSTVEVAGLFNGIHETADFQWAMQSVFANLKNDPDPTLALEQLRDNARGIAANAELALTHFQRLKMRHYIEVGTNQFDEDRRYRLPEENTDNTQGAR